jgi:hypothetical protein
LHTYRLLLEQRRDEQRRWPARRLPVIACTSSVAFLLGIVRLFAGASTKPMDAFSIPILIAAFALASYAFTRKLTNHAAAAFQQELDDTSGPRSP